MQGEMIFKLVEEALQSLNDKQPLDVGGTHNICTINLGRLQGHTYAALKLFEKYPDSWYGTANKECLPDTTEHKRVFTYANNSVRKRFIGQETPHVVIFDQAYQLTEQDRQNLFPVITVNPNTLFVFLG